MYDIGLGPDVEPCLEAEDKTNEGIDSKLQSTECQWFENSGHKTHKDVSSKGGPLEPVPAAFRLRYLRRCEVGFQCVEILCVRLHMSHDSLNACHLHNENASDGSYSRLHPSRGSHLSPPCHHYSVQRLNGAVFFTLA